MIDNIYSHIQPSAGGSVPCKKTAYLFTFLLLDFPVWTLISTLWNCFMYQRWRAISWSYMNKIQEMRKTLKWEQHKQTSRTDKPANLSGAGPFWLWTYQERVQRTWCRSPAPCWEGGLVSVWYIYCSATDTSEAPENKSHLYITQNRTKYRFLLAIVSRHWISLMMNFNMSPRQTEKRFTCLTSCTDRRSRTM